MRRAFHVAWALLALGMVLGYPLLPEQIGDPGKEASRAAWAGLMLFVALNAWLCSHHFILWVGRRWPESMNVPHKEHWWAPERREASLQRLATHTSALGIQVCLLAGGLYAWPTMQAQIGPLPAAWGWAAAALLIGAFALWVVAQLRMFPAPPAATPSASRRPRRPDKRVHGQP